MWFDIMKNNAFAVICALWLWALILPWLLLLIS
jgi:hypothetical protein